MLGQEILFLLTQLSHFAIELFSLLRRWITSVDENLLVWRYLLFLFLFASALRALSALLTPQILFRLIFEAVLR